MQHRKSSLLSQQFKLHFIIFTAKIIGRSKKKRTSVMCGAGKIGNGRLKEQYEGGGCFHQLFNVQATDLRYGTRTSRFRTAISFLHFGYQSVENLAHGLPLNQRNCSNEKN